MDLETKANVRPCPNCGTINVEDARFCQICGTRLEEDKSVEEANGQEEEKQQNNMEGAAFVAINEETADKEVMASQEEKGDSVQVFIEEDSDEEESVFAEGLPKWDIVPPEIVVRRKSRK